MVNRQINIENNNKLKKLYEKVSSEYIKAWEKKFNYDAPTKLTTFGIVDPENYDTDNGILFIGKETRGEVPDFLLWLNMMATKFETLEDKDRTKHPQIWYNIGRWAKFIHNPRIDKQTLLSEKEKAFEGLKHIAFTNINKVYGGSSSKNEFRGLSENQMIKNILQEEICIISPKTIVLCGKGLIDIFEGIKTDAKIIEMPHPSARIKKEDMIKQLGLQLKEFDCL